MRCSAASAAENAWWSRYAALSTRAPRSESCRSNACGSRPVDSSVFAWEAGATTGGDWTSCNGYFESVFYRGTEFLNAVRAAMGDDAFFAAMHSWVEKHRHGFVTGDRLLRHLQRQTDADLDSIFAAYLENPVAVLRGRAADAFAE